MNGSRRDAGHGREVPAPEPQQALARARPEAARAATQALLRADRARRRARLERAPAGDGAARSSRTTTCGRSTRRSSTAGCSASARTAATATSRPTTRSSRARAGVAALHHRATGEPRYLPMVMADKTVGLIAVQMIADGALSPRAQPAKAARSRSRCSRTWRSSCSRSTCTSRPSSRRSATTGDPRLLDPLGKPLRRRTAGSASPPTPTRRRSRCSRRSAGRS